MNTSARAAEKTVLTVYAPRFRPGEQRRWTRGTMCAEQIRDGFETSSDRAVMRVGSLAAR